MQHIYSGYRCAAARRPIHLFATSITMRHCHPPLSLLLTPLLANASDLHLPNVDVQKVANGVLSLMSYSAVPDLASSSLSIDNSSSGNPGVFMTQLGGGATMSKSTPVYLEGSIAYSRYDPTFVASNGQESREIPLRWNNVTATGGIGYDFPITDVLVWRPIFNFSLGKIASDTTIGEWLVNEKLGTDIDFVDGGEMNAYGLGGSIMLDLEDFKPSRDIDLELRYTNIQLRSYGHTSTGATGKATAETASIYYRWRAPIGGFTLLERPFRYVLEASNTQYLGSQRGVLGFNYLSSLGVGVELDSSAYNIFVTRTRLVARYMFGNNVSGTSIGLACSF